MISSSSKQRDAALAFVERFCAGDIDGLKPLLSPNVQVKGPWYRFDSREAYLDSLRKDPPEPCRYRILNIAGSTDTVSIYYDYDKGDRVITIAQLFTFKRQKISEMLIVFDGRGFS